ncbi:Butyrophilin subfamily 3 member A3 [Collichthys lucidus]|uniref:Butyrophilin subfamily 3 member A3 n=1 Tax=Collichthys lucidus TaxID=240159 RepID=A0A4U5VY79_COLLU|nr:Butyrophilin subfamily 3 member A3 [Collichthys lucidus]
MIGPNHGLFLKPELSLVFQHIVILLLLAEPCRAQPEGAVPFQTVVTLVGEDVILPCHLQPAMDIVSESMEWGRLDLEPRFVHVWYGGQNYLVNQNPSYKGRTSVSGDNLKRGDFSLKLSAVKHSDQGKYRCHFPSRDQTSNVELVVGSVSSPVIAGININSSKLVLQCESKGWYPEPEVFWLDAEGNLLSAGPTETVRGPDDLYTVSSRLTVEKSDSFTCRVQQKNINQTRETHIQISADYFGATCSSATRVGIIVVPLLMFILAAAFAVWKWKQPQSKVSDEDEEREREKLMAQKQLKEEKDKLEEWLQGKQKILEEENGKLKELEEQHRELKDLRDQLKRENEEEEKNIEDIERKVKSVEERVEIDSEIKEIIFDAKKQLCEMKQKYEKLHHYADTLLAKTDGLSNKLTDWMNEVDNHKVEISDLTLTHAD